MAGKRYRVWVVDLRKAHPYYTWPMVYLSQGDAVTAWGLANVKPATLTIEPPKPKRRKKNA